VLEGDKRENEDLTEYVPPVRQAAPVKKTSGSPLGNFFDWIKNGLF
jgi:hypothetical protein